jgi:Cys-rich repeat protein
MRINFGSAAVAALFLTLVGCAGDSDDDAGSSASASNGETGADSMTSGTPGDGDGDGDGTSVGTSATNGDDPPEPQPNGSECNSNEECESGMCFHVSILGGLCGECLVDDDCPDGGCSIPNPLSDPPQGATCNNGEQGGGCMSDDVCVDDLTCEVILDIPGIFTASTCSQCETDGDCGDGQLCSPAYDIPNLSGARVCVDPGTVANGEGCDHTGSGDDACESGFCHEYDVMGFLTLGVCGECKVDADCEDGEVCNDPDVDLDTLEVTPPTCG